MAWYGRVVMKAEVQDMANKQSLLKVEYPWSRYGSWMDKGKDGCLKSIPGRWLARLSIMYLLGLLVSI